MTEILEYQTERGPSDSGFRDAIEAGDTLVAQYWVRGEPNDLQFAVVRYQSALNCAQDNEDDIQAKLSLANTIRIQYEDGLAGESQFSEALTLAEDAVQKASPSSPLHLRALRVLGELLLRRLHPREIEHLERAEKAFNELVTLATDLHSDLLVQALALNAYACICQHDRLGSADKMLAANALVDRALTLTTIVESTVPELPICVALARSRRARHASTSNVEDIDQAVRTLEHVLSKTTENDPRLPFYLYTLGYYHNVKWGFSAAPGDMDSRIHAYMESKKRVPVHHPIWHMVHGNYGTAMYHRFIARSNPEDLEEALAVYREVISVCNSQPERPVFSTSYVTALADSLVLKYAYTGDLGLLDDAVDTQLNNVSLIKEAALPADLPPSLHALAKAYFVRFSAHRRMSDIDNAVSLFEESLPGFFIARHKVEASCDLAEALMARFDERSQDADIERAVVVLRTALTIPAPESRGRVWSLLGAALLSRGISMENPADLEEAISCQREALGLLPEKHSELASVHFRMGIAHYQSFLLSHDLISVGKSLVALRSSLSLMPVDHPDRSAYLWTMARSEMVYVQQPEDVGHVLETLKEAASHQQSRTSDRYTAAAEAARLAHQYGYLLEAMEAYRLAISFLPQIAWLGLEDELRMQHLSKQTSDISQDAAACAIELGQYEVAVEVLETSRSIVWNTGQELRADLAKLRELYPELATELFDTNAALSYRVPASGLDEPEREAERRRLHNLASKRTALMDAVRTKPEFERFLMPPAYQLLQQAAARGPIIVLNSSVYRCDALIVRVDDPIALIPLTELNHDQLRKEVWILQSLLRNAKDKSGLQYLECALNTLLRGLWESVGSRVCLVLQDYLQSQEYPRLWWCPTGAMSFLPFHACGPYDGSGRGMADLAVSSYTPTLSALIRSRSAITPSLPRKTPYFLVVSQPDIPDWVPLPCAAHELAILENLFPEEGTFMLGSQGSVSAVADALPKHSWFHISSHGTQNAINPLRSSLALYDGPLTLSHLAHARLPNAEFAFLSACHSAKGTATMPDESMHLAAGMMFAGFKSVVATSWGIVDKDAPQVTHILYDYLRRDGRMPEVTDTAEALHVAVNYLRASHVAAYRWVPFIHLGA